MRGLRRRKRGSGQTLLVPEAGQQRVVDIVRLCAQCVLQTGF